MKAVFAIPGALDTPTGGYAYARRLLRAADGAGIDFEHLALPFGFPLPSAEAMGETEKLLSAVDPKIPLLIDGLAYGALPARLIQTVRAPIVALCHHPLAMETGLAPQLVQHFRATEAQALSEAKFVITTSHATAEILKTDYDIPTGRLTVAPPGTDPAPRGNGSGGPVCRLLSVGSLTPRKGHLRLVEAMAELVDLNWTLRIVGPMPDPAHRVDLEASIERHSLTDRIELAGPLGLPALTAAYQSADLFVLASEYEGFGMAFVEAMSHGLPTVGVTCPAVEEATAGAASLGPAETLADRLRPVVGSDAMRADLADQCWTAAQTFLRWPQTATIVAGVLREAAP